MNSQDAKRYIKFFEDAPNDFGGVSWCRRAARMLRALLPVLDEPSGRALQGNSLNFLDIEVLISCANRSIGSEFESLWDGVRQYLVVVPGLIKTPDGNIAVRDRSSMGSIICYHGFITDQINRVPVL